MLLVVHNASFMILTALHASLQLAHCCLHPQLPHLSSCRQLAHRSFQTPKWLEYALSYCGVLAVEGDPIEWVSAHRYHHLHCDTPLDPHSPYEGFWWSHMGWLLDNKVRFACRTLQVD
jgi:fatty-acid desaturase